MFTQSQKEDDEATTQDDDKQQKGEPHKLAIYIDP